MEHFSPAGSASGAAGSSNNAGNEALSPTHDNTSVHQYADINPQAGSAAVDESSSAHFKRGEFECAMKVALYDSNKVLLETI